MIQYFALAIMLLSIIINSFVLGLDLESVAIAIGGSFSGAFLLAYFRRERSRSELCFKIASASLSGIVCGSALIKYLNLASKEYVLFWYFATALVSLVVIGALLSFSEKNVKEVIITVAHRVFNFTPTEKETERKRNPLSLIHKTVDTVDTIQETKITIEDK